MWIIHIFTHIIWSTLWLAKLACHGMYRSNLSITSHSLPYVHQLEKSGCQAAGMIDSSRPGPPHGLGWWRGLPGVTASLSNVCWACRDGAGGLCRVLDMRVCWKLTSARGGRKRPKRTSADAGVDVGVDVPTNVSFLRRDLAGWPVTPHHSFQSGWALLLGDGGGTEGNLDVRFQMMMMMATDSNHVQSRWQHQLLICSQSCCLKELDALCRQVEKPFWRLSWWPLLSWVLLFLRKVTVCSRISVFSALF